MKAFMRAVMFLMVFGLLGAYTVPAIAETVKPDSKPADTSSAGSANNKTKKGGKKDAADTKPAAGKDEDKKEEDKKTLPPPLPGVDPEGKPLPGYKYAHQNGLIRMATSKKIIPAGPEWKKIDTVDALRKAGEGETKRADKSERDLLDVRKELAELKKNPTAPAGTPDDAALFKKVADVQTEKLKKKEEENIKLQEQVTQLTKENGSLQGQVSTLNGQVAKINKTLEEMKRNKQPAQAQPSQYGTQEREKYRALLRSSGIDPDTFKAIPDIN